MDRRTVRRRGALLVMVLLAGLVGVAAGPARADGYEPVNPPYPDPHAFDPQLSVTPSDALLDGQTVQVTGRYFGVSIANGVLRECTADLARCDTQTTTFTTGTNGEFNPVNAPATPNDPPTVPVAFVAKAGFVAGNGTTVDCLATACVLYARWSDAFEVDAAAHHLNFLAPSAGRYTPLTPARILDTRFGTGGFSGPFGPGAKVDVPVTGRGGVPATGVTAVVMNVTATEPTASGYLTLYPTGSPQPTASNLNFTPGKTVPNLVVVKVGTGGQVTVFNPAGTTHVVFDVAGYYAGNGVGNAGRYQPLVPTRLVDTRPGVGGTRLGPGASLDVQVAGQGGVPATGAQAAVLNVAVTGTTAPSFVTVYPTGEVRPNSSNVNFNAGDTVSNRTVAKLGAGGKVTVFNSSGSTDVVVDVGGWYTDPSVPGVLGTFVALPPARIYDTRTGAGGATGPVGATATVDIQVTGQGGVPGTGVRAAILNVTVAGPAAVGYLTVYPKGAAQPNASDLNYAAGEIRPNLVVVQLGVGGAVSVYSPTQTHVIVDVAGWSS